MATRLTGAEVAKEILIKSEADAQKLRAADIAPCLAVVRVGDSPDDAAYERSILKRCEAARVEVARYSLPQEASTEAVLNAIREINDRRGIHGALVMRPLPKQIDDRAVCAALDIRKDLDGISPLSMSALYAGQKGAAAPCTAEACIALLDYYHIPVEGKNVTVIGRSLVIGKPIAMLLIQRNATVTVCHTKTRDLAGCCRRADIILAAAGVAGMVTADFVRAGQVVVDVGINVNESGALCGDADSGIADIVAAYTPVPGGVGTVTAAILARNTVEAAKRI